MKSRTLRMKILSAMLCAGITFSGASISYATVQHNESETEKPTTSMDFRVSMEKEKTEESRDAEKDNILKAAIKESVESNVITQAEGDKVLEYVTLKFRKKCEDDSRCKDKKSDFSKGGFFKELVTEGILTKEKAEALRERVQAKKTDVRNDELQKGLTTLVANKVLTIEQSSKVAEAIMAAEAAAKEEHKKMKDMNEKEKEEHMKKMKENRVDPMKALIDNGTITKEQQKEIQKMLPHHYRHHHEDK